MGIGMAHHYGANTPAVWLWAVLCVLCLQILSNIANDYGDGTKGTDNAKRLGPERGLQSGAIQPKQMKTAMYILAAMSFAAGIILLYVSPLAMLAKAAFLALGLLSIAAAILYTVGNKAYGYHGMGDLFVFLFFGYVAVLGPIILSGVAWHYSQLLPATTVGALSVAVLNLNNMRDIVNDKASGKHTLAVFLGRQKARYYHIGIIQLAFGSMLIWTVLAHTSLYSQAVVAVFYSLCLRDLVHITKAKKDQALDPYLKRTALFTLAFVVCFWVVVGVL